MPAPEQTDPHPVKQGVAGVTTFAAAALLCIVGFMGLFQGIAAAANDDLIIVGPAYTYQFDLTTWGWIHIIVGVLALIVAFGMFAGATWARIAAIVIAALSIIANFLWLPYYPWWSILIIAVNVLVIWAVATWDAR